jgi:hypothetical protein
MKRELIDTSVFCGHWPFRKLALQAPAELKAHLSKFNVQQAWISAFETVLHADPMDSNEALAASVAQDPFFAPVPVINVTLATWKRDLQTCLENWKCRIIKLIPNYHQYELTDPRVAELLSITESAGVPVCVQLRMQDERGHHLLVKVPAVNVANLTALTARHPRNRFLACGAYLKEPQTFRESKNIWAEISFAESGQSINGAIKSMDPRRIVFGSHSPLYYFEAQVKKLDVDEAEATQDQLKKIAQTNAVELLKGKP